MCGGDHGGSCHSYLLLGYSTLPLEGDEMVVIQGHQLGPCDTPRRNGCDQALELPSGELSDPLRGRTDTESGARRGRDMSSEQGGHEN